MDFAKFNDSVINKHKFQLNYVLDLSLDFKTLDHSDLLFILLY